MTTLVLPENSLGALTSGAENDAVPPAGLPHAARTGSAIAVIPAAVRKLRREMFTGFCAEPDRAKSDMVVISWKMLNWQGKVGKPISVGQTLRQARRR
jgi:hypothetical protein